MQVVSLDVEIEILAACDWRRPPFSYHFTATNSSSYIILIHATISLWTSVKCKPSHLTTRVSYHSHQDHPVRLLNSRCGSSTPKLPMRFARTDKESRALDERHLTHASLATQDHLGIASSIHGCLRRSEARFLSSSSHLSIVLTKSRNCALASPSRTVIDSSREISGFAVSPASFQRPTT